MKKLLAILCLLTTQVQARDIIISDPHGGEILPYIVKVQKSIADLDRPVFVGRNVSAAILWTGNPRACAMPGSSLVFHGMRAINSVTRQDISSTHPEEIEKAKKEFMSILPPAIARIAPSLINDPDKFYEIRTPELWNYVKRCDEMPNSYASQFTGIPIAGRVHIYPKKKRVKRVNMRTKRVNQFWFDAMRYYAPPPQCDYEPRQPYTVQIVPRGACGDGSPACTILGQVCHIRIENWAIRMQSALLRHEKGHCNCPRWID